MRPSGVGADAGAAAWVAVVHGHRHPLPAPSFPSFVLSRHRQPTAVTDLAADDQGTCQQEEKQQHERVGRTPVRAGQHHVHAGPQNRPATRGDRAVPGPVGRELYDRGKTTTAVRRRLSDDLVIVRRDDNRCARPASRAGGDQRVPGGENRMVQQQLAGYRAAWGRRGRRSRSGRCAPARRGSYRLRRAGRRRLWAALSGGHEQAARAGHRQLRTAARAVRQGSARAGGTGRRRRTRLPGGHRSTVGTGHPLRGAFVGGWCG